MEVSRMIAKVNLNTDEDFETIQVLEFMNDAIQKINVECGAVFPEIDITLPEEMYALEDYTAIPDKWINTLIIPFAAGRIKENDSSQFEYMDWYSQFDQNLQMFKSRYVIPTEYVDADDTEGRYEDDYSQSMFSHLKGW